MPYDFEKIKKPHDIMPTLLDACGVQIPPKVKFLIFSFILKIKLYFLNGWNKINNSFIINSFEAL